MRSGNVESNPGPLKEDNLLLEEDKRFQDQGGSKAKNNKARGGGATNKAKKYVMGREEEKRKSLEARVEKMSETLAFLMEKANSHEGRIAKAEMEIFPPNLDKIEVDASKCDEVTTRRLLEENAKLRADIKLKEKNYEVRLNEADVELSSLKSQLTELMGVYDDLQVSLL